MRSSSALPPTDEDLVARADGGDGGAFATLYERHASALYDFAVRVTRDRDAAADVVQTTFAKAWTNLPRDVRNMKAWLFAVARNAAVDEVRRRRREDTAGQDDDGDDPFARVPAGPGSDPEARAQERELASLVWSAAAALGPSEYALLDLHVRRDLGADEIAEALGLKKGAVYTRLSRLRDSLEDSVTSLLLLRRGRRECDALDGLLTKLRATELTREVHAAIRTHLRECERCSETKRRFVSPVEILAGLTPVAAAPGLLERIWRDVATQVESRPPGSGRRGLRRLAAASRRAKALLAAALAVAVAGSTAGVLALSAGPSVVEDPLDVHSTTHDVGLPSTDPVVRMAWSRVEDATAYSVSWSAGAEDVPDAEADLPGNATATASPELPPGSWHFHLRTQGGDGRWTSTVHVGPFVIEGAEPVETALPSLAVHDDLIQEPTSGRATAAFLVELSSPSDVVVTARYATTDGSARDGRDYRGAGGTISIEPGETDALVEVAVIADRADEREETFFLELSEPSGATLADPRARATIVARAVPPDLSVAGDAVTEGTAVEAVFEVSLTEASEGPVSVRWETLDGTASGGADYTSSSGTLIFRPGEITTVARVPILDDTLDEPDETFSLRLSDASVARLLDAEAVGTIRDDDDPEAFPTPALSIGDRSVAEGDGGTTALGFTVRLSGPSGESVGVGFEVRGDSARLGDDVLAASGTLRIPPGATTAAVAVRVVGDEVDEPNERFFVDLSRPDGADLADGQAVGTIRDDDAAPTLSIDDASVGEGAGTASVTVRLSGQSSERVTVRFATTPGSASAGSDYATTSGTASFPPGATSAEASVPIVDDDVDEPDEAFAIELSSPHGASIGDGRAEVAIGDDDRTPGISIDDVSSPEGTGSSRTFAFTVRLSNPSSSAVRVDFATVAGSAQPGQDFIATSGTLTLAAGQTTATVAVPVIPDTILEPDETFSVSLSGPTNGSIGDGTGIGTIENDDGSVPRTAHRPGGAIRRHGPAW